MTEGASRFAFAREHPGLVLSVATAAAVVGKVLLAARGDVGTAVALVSSGVPAVLLGVAVLYAPLLTVFLAVGAFWWRTRENSVVSGIAFTVGLLPAAAVLPFLYIVILMVVPPVAILLWQGSAAIRSAGRKLAAWMDWDRSRGLDYLLYLVVGGLVFGPAVWLPREALVIQGVGEVAGYVVEEEGLWVTVLRDDTRAVLRIAPADLTDRYLCDSPGVRWLSLPQMLEPPAPLPDCPE